MTSSKDAATNETIFYDDNEANSNFQVISMKQDDDAIVRRQCLATEAIEQLASGINLAANTIEEYSQNTIDEENLKQLNDEQLLRLLEEAYHSKKLDEKNKSAIFKEILEDVHESLAASDNNKAATVHSSKSTPSHHKSKSYSKRNASTFDSIAALTEIMDSSNIPSSASGVDNDADTSSTKTEVEEMELDQFSDLEDNIRAHENAKKLDENGNPSSASAGSSVSFTARQLKPLSIYRHNPAFHSQHVSVNQMDEIPPLSPTALQPTTPLPNCKSEERQLPAKARRKKKAVKTEEMIKAEEIDGYRGSEDLESLLQFIESKPKGQRSASADQQVITASSQSLSCKSKRSRRVDRKSKRSRTPSVTTSNKEKSPASAADLNSQKTSRASSLSKPAAAAPPAEPSQPDSVTTVKNSLIMNNASNKKVPKKPKKQAGWLVDFNNETKSSSNRIKNKPPSGKSITTEVTKIREDNITVDQQDDTKYEDSSDELTTSLQEDIPEEDQEKETSTSPTLFQPIKKSDQEDEICFNYASILKFIKHEWDIVTMEISNGADIQSKSLSVTPTNRHRLIPGSPAPHAMIKSQSNDFQNSSRKNMPQSPKISIYSAEDDEDEDAIADNDKLVEMKGMGVAVSHPLIELGSKKPPALSTPNHHLSASSQHRSMMTSSSSGSLSSSVSSNEGSVGTRRPPTSLSVLSASSLAEVTKTIREQHSSIDGGLSPPPRVVSLEDARGFKVMTELVNHDLNPEQKQKNLHSKYKPLKPIPKKK